MSAATCTEAEVQIRTCVLDPTQSEKKTVGEALGHDWDEEETTIPATETKNGIIATICKNDPEHIDKEKFSGEYATGTPGLAYALLTGTNANTYRVSKGTFNGSAVHIPAYHRPNADSSYLPVRQVNNGTLNTFSQNAFGGTSSNRNTTLTAVTFAEDSQITSIANYAFSYSTNLTSITLPDSVMSIGDGALAYTSITSITIPEGVTAIGNNTFDYCTELTSVTIPDGVTTIGNSAFRGCTNLVSITIPESVTSFHSTGSQFHGCKKLESITIPANVTTIVSSMFYDCAGLTNIIIPDGVTGIGNNAFNGCINLASVTLPEGLVAIGQYAFEYCALTSVIIPASVKSISNGAFRNTGLTSITFKGNDIATISTDFVGITTVQFRTLYNAQPATARAGTYTFNGTEWEKTSEL